MIHQVNNMESLNQTSEYNPSKRAELSGINWKKMDCDKRETYSIGQLISQSAYSKAIHFWSIRWLLTNSGGFREFFSNQTNFALILSIKDRLVYLMDSQSMDKLEIEFPDEMRIGKYKMEEFKIYYILR
jgi:hypothetical protein